MLDKFESNTKANRIHQDALLLKVKLQREKIEVIRSPDEFKKLIDSVGILLMEIEAQLQQQAGSVVDSVLLKIKIKTLFSSSSFRMIQTFSFLQKTQTVGCAVNNLCWPM